MASNFLYFKKNCQRISCAESSIHVKVYTVHTQSLLTVTCSQYLIFPAQPHISLLIFNVLELWSLMVIFDLILFASLFWW